MAHGPVALAKWCKVRYISTSLQQMDQAPVTNFQTHSSTCSTALQQMVHGPVLIVHGLLKNGERPMIAHGQHPFTKRCKSGNICSTAMQKMDQDPVANGPRLGSSCSTARQYMFHDPVVHGSTALQPIVPSSVVYGPQPCSKWLMDRQHIVHDPVENGPRPGNTWLQALYQTAQTRVTNA